MVGLANTVIDFGLLFALRALGLAIIPANMISTAAALTFSFFANRRFTFASSGGYLWQAVNFVVVTLIGLWVLQPVVLLIGTGILTPSLGEGWALFVAKVIATVVSMVWNYLLYDRVVFRGQRTPAAEQEQQ